MAAEKETFLSRWSRVKSEALPEREGGSGKTPLPASTPPPEAVPAKPLPPVDELSFESDFTAFMHSKVEQGVKRAALKKLFADPRFNVMDGLDTYIDDYSIEDPIPPDLLEKLQHARRTLFGPEPEQPVPEEGDDQPEAQAEAPIAEKPEDAGDRG